MLRNDLVNPILMVSALAPGTSLSGTTAANGPWNDTSGVVGPVALALHVAAASGSPTSFAHKVKFQESDFADGTGATDVKINDESAQADSVFETTIPAAGVYQIQPRNRSKKFLRAVVTPSFVGGTTPASPVSAILYGVKSEF